MVACPTCGHENPSRQKFCGECGAPLPLLCPACGAPVTATQRAYAAAFGIVQRQATMLSFVELFRGLGVMFLLLVPLVMLMKRPRSAAGAAAAH